MAVQTTMTAKHRSGKSALAASQVHYILAVFLFTCFSLRYIDTNKRINSYIEDKFLSRETGGGLPSDSLEVTLRSIGRDDTDGVGGVVPNINELCPEVVTKAERDRAAAALDNVLPNNDELGENRRLGLLQDAHTAGSKHAGKQRIVLYTGAYNHIRDGVALTLNRMVSYLLGQGHEVLVLAPTNSNPVIDHAGDLRPVPSVILPGRSDYRLSISLTANLKQQIVDFDPTIVHIATPDFVGFQVQKWAREQQHLPVVCSFHTHFTSYLSYYNLGFLEGMTWDLLRRFYSSCDHTYVPSHGIADELREHGVHDGLLLWTRGVDTEMYSPSRRCPALRSKLAVDDDEPVVLLACRLVWEKGLQVYVDVIRKLEAAGVRHKSVVAGDGPARAKMQQLLPNTVFLGAQSSQQLSCAYASADVYVFPSHTETFGVTTLEALASGLPVVVANASGPAMMVEHGRNGFMAPPSDSEAFYRYTRRLVERADLRKTMGRAAREIAHTTFHWGGVFKNLVEYYDGLVPPAQAQTHWHTHDESDQLGGGGDVAVA